jgi:YD repeat-containing protein
VQRRSASGLLIAPAALSGEAQPNGAWVSYTTGLDETTRDLLDYRGRVWQQVNPMGDEEEWDLDSAGDPIEYQDPDGYLTTYTYDDNGNLTETEYPNGTSTEAEYDSTFSQLIYSKDADGNVTTYSLNAYGDVTAMVDLLGTTTYTYGTGAEIGLVVSSTDPLGRVTNTTYDSDRRVSTALLQPRLLGC